MMMGCLIKSSRMTSVLTSSVFFFYFNADVFAFFDTYNFYDIFQLELWRHYFLSQYLLKSTGISALIKRLNGSVSDYRDVIICGSFVALFLKSETIINAKTINISILLYAIVNNMFLSVVSNT